MSSIAGATGYSYDSPLPEWATQWQGRDAENVGWPICPTGRDINGDYLVQVEDDGQGSPRIYSPLLEGVLDAGHIDTPEDARAFAAALVAAADVLEGIRS